MSQRVVVEVRRWPQQRDTQSSLIPSIRLLPAHEMTLQSFILQRTRIRAEGLHTNVSVERRKKQEM